jgi:phosphoribosylformylglycinamidine synthase subunit PurL
MRANKTLYPLQLWGKLKIACHNGLAIQRVNPLGWHGCYVCGKIRIMMTAQTPPTQPQTGSVTITEETATLLAQFNLTHDEYQRIVAGMGREPNFTELSMFSVLWSEHCCYKHSKHLLRTLPTQGKAILQGPGENAGVVDCGDGIHVAFKIESHNHPTAVEPYQGAATGVGGILRDIFTMNARPIANLNALRFGPLTQPHNQYLFRRAVKGIGDYGNCVGVPTMGGDVFFDPCYSGNPLVNAMAVGLLQGPIVSSKAAGIGNPVVYVGSHTGKDGMGGAAFASRQLDDNSQQDRPAVQVGDPFAEKLLIEACLEAFKTGCVVAAQDMGAAGLTSSSCEMAAKGGVGMRMDLDKVPAREPGMQAWEYMLSESQERMLFVLHAGQEQPVLDIFKKWGLHAAIIGEVIERPFVEVYQGGEKVVDIAAALLAEDVPDYDPGIVPTEPDEARQRREAPAFDSTTVGAAVPMWSSAQALDTLAQMLGSANVAKPLPVFQQYDRHVQNNTLLTSDQLGAGVFRLRHPHTNLPSGKAMAVTTDCNPRHVYLNPKTGAAGAVAEACRNVVAVGATPLAVTDNLNFGNPKTAEVYYQLYEATSGIKEACLALNTPVTGGNVSLYNETHTAQAEGPDRIEAIYPTPIIGLVGLLTNEAQLMTPHVKHVGDVVALVGRFAPSLGGSQLQAIWGYPCQGEPPSIALDTEQTTAQWLHTQWPLLASVQDVSLGGVLTTLAECWLQAEPDLGVFIDPLALDDYTAPAATEAETLPPPQHPEWLQWFGETHGCYVITCKPTAWDALCTAAETAAVPLRRLGSVVMAQGDTPADLAKGGSLAFGTAQLNRTQAHTIWTTGVKLVG